MRNQNHNRNQANRTTLVARGIFRRLGHASAAAYLNRELRSGRLALVRAADVTPGIIRIGSFVTAEARNELS